MISPLASAGWSYEKGFLRGVSSQRLLSCQAHLIEDYVALAWNDRCQTIRYR